MEPFYMFLFFQFNNTVVDFLFDNWTSYSGSGELSKGNYIIVIIGWQIKEVQIPW